MQDLPFVSWFVQLLIATGSVEFSILVLIAGAVAVAVTLHWVGFKVLVPFLDKEGPGPAVVKRVREPLRLAVILVALAVVLPAADFDTEIAETLRRCLRIGLAILLGWSGVVGINAAAHWMERKHRLDVDDNLTARRVHTQINILRRIAILMVLLLAAGSVLLSFPAVQAYGVSLFASAGAAGLVLGLAARPILANVIAGIQIALTQPIRIDDVVIVEREWGWIEEITTTYVVVRIWDQRRLVVPLSHFIEKPFENWTRESADIIGAVVWHVDYRAPVDAMRRKLDEILAASKLWDGKVANLQVVESGPATVTVRALMSARTSPRAWDLRCEVREAMLEWLRETHPEALPRMRASIEPRSPERGALAV